MKDNVKQNVKKYTVKTVGTVIVPLLFFVVCQILCAANGVQYLGRTGAGLMFFQTVATVMLTAFALHINLNSGRFDFSLGSIALLSSVISAKICIASGAPTIVMLLLSIVFGIILGAASGAIYVLLKLPAIVVSLGVTLVYEGLAFIVTDGLGVSFVTNKELISFPSIGNYIAVIAVALVIMIAIFDFTKIGYEHKSLMHGQKISVNTGIKEIPNAIFSYGFCGMLMSVVGFINATSSGTIQMSLNFGSIGVMFSAFFPLFVGGFIGRFSNDKFGYFLGAAASAFVNTMYFCIGVEGYIQQIVTALILVLFVVYLSNEHIIKKLPSMLKGFGKKQKGGVA